MARYSNLSHISLMHYQLVAGDCWIALSLALGSGLILAARVGKHTDKLIEQLVVITEGKTGASQFCK